MVPLSPLSPLRLCLLLFIAATAAAAEWLKLSLLRQTNSTNAIQTLSSDNRRLSFLYSSLQAHGGGGPTFKSPIISAASAGSGQYLVSLRLGTPPQSFRLVVDTGSDLIWIKCSACRNCSDHPPESAFFPRHSPSFSPTHCFAPPCQLVPHPYTRRHRLACNRTRLHSPCRYRYPYADGSFAAGMFSTETASLNTSFGRVARFRTLAFGCAFRISGPSVTGSSFSGAVGVMGLGRGPISFASQLGRRFGGDKFSYCLMDFTLSPPPTSYLLVGGSHGKSSAVRSGMSFTPLVINRLSPTFYYVGIKAVFVDGVKLRIEPSVWAIDDLGNGGTIVDSGTTLTFLPDPAYRQILAAFRFRVELRRHSVSNPDFDLCVNASAVPNPSFPKLSFELAGDSLFAPPVKNYVIDTALGVKCVAIQPVRSPSGVGVGVIGNMMQQGFLLEFDNARLRLGFSRRGCAIPV